MLSVQAGGERSAAAGGNAGAIITGDHNVTHVHPQPPALTALADLLAVVVIVGLIAWRYGDDDPDMPTLAAVTEYTQSRKVATVGYFLARIRKTFQSLRASRPPSGHTGKAVLMTTKRHSE